MKVTLTLDDFSIENNRLDLLFKLKEHFPNFKVNLFTVPNDFKHPIKHRDEELKKIKECLDWIQIIPHGLRHNSSEAKRWNYEQFRYAVIPEIERIFERDGLPFERGFKSPHWDTHSNVAQALTDLGWWQAISPKRKDQPHARRFYIHDFTINEDFPLKDIKLQGHINNTSPDDLELNFNNLLKIPKNATWHFVSEHL